MEPAQQRLVELLGKKENNSLTEAEAAEFTSLLNEAGVEQTLSPVLYEGWKEILAQGATPALSQEQIDRLMASLPAEEKEEQTVVIDGRSRFVRSWWAAAAVVLMLGAGIWLVIGRKDKPAVTQAAKKTTEIMPGKGGAVLTLADGSRVLLDTVRNGIVARQGNAMVKVVDGVLYYEGNAATVLYNTMHTPKGRKYQITLPDGTLVWLNAASSIRYPTMFTNNERRVEVTGEVYLEVAKQVNPANGKSLPFLVNINNKATVEVLGTHFNIKAYEEETSINTTLLEGKVKVTGNNKEAVLTPGQQAQIIQQGNDMIRVVKAVDVEQVIAWKNDLFNFEGASLEEAMRQLERWYDISVSYENGIPDVKLRGEMTQGVRLNDLLIALEQLGLHYKLEGRKLHILQ
jgi:transmembrane sensor